eukprot:scaffold11832_cov155-Skeletonema_marinoi.AAC.1
MEGKERTGPCTSSLVAAMNLSKKIPLKAGCRLFRNAASFLLSALKPVLLFIAICPSHAFYFYTFHHVYVWLGFLFLHPRLNEATAWFVLVRETTLFRFQTGSTSTAIYDAVWIILLRMKTPIERQHSINSSLASPNPHGIVMENFNRTFKITGSEGMILYLKETGQTAIGISLERYVK